jgi:hypothetical protein
MPGLGWRKHPDKPGPNPWVEVFQLLTPRRKKEQILRLFDELNPQFQDYVLHVVSQLIKIQQEHQTYGLRDTIPD